MVSDNGLSRSLTTISRTKIIHARTKINVMATNLAVILNSHPDAVLIGNTQESHITGDRVQRTNLDRLTRTNLDSPQRTITQMLTNRGNLHRSRLRSRNRRSRSSSSRRRRSSRSRSSNSRSRTTIVAVRTASSGYERQCEYKHQNL